MAYLQGHFRLSPLECLAVPIRKQGASGSLVVPIEELMRNLPLAIPLEQSEYVGSSGIGTSQLP